jgi:hypothetical protein
MDEVYVGLCVVQRRGPELFEVDCPGGKAVVTPEEVRIYTPEGVYAYFEGAHGVRGKVSAVRPVREKLYQKLGEIGFRADSRPYTPGELFAALRYGHLLEAGEEGGGQEEDEELRELRERLAEFGRRMRELEEALRARR